MLNIDLKKIFPVAIFLFIMAWLFEATELGANVSLADILPSALFIGGGVLFFAAIGKTVLDSQKRE